SGSIAFGWLRAGHFRSSTNNGHHQIALACLKGATNGLMHRSKTMRIIRSHRAPGGPWTAAHNALSANSNLSHTGDKPTSAPLRSLFRKEVENGTGERCRIKPRPIMADILQ